MNPDGCLVRWQLISIREVYALFDEALDPRGTEIYSKLRTVRMLPEYRWRPKRGPDLRVRRGDEDLDVFLQRCSVTRRPVISMTRFMSNTEVNE